MKRQIYIVTAHIVDANGAFHVLDGYPKKFDSKTYGNDIDKAQRRAEGEFSDVWGAMCKQDTRQMQTVILMTADGFVIEKKSSGMIADVEPEQ